MNSKIRFIIPLSAILVCMFTMSLVAYSFSMFLVFAVLLNILPFMSLYLCFDYVKENKLSVLTLILGNTLILASYIYVFWTEVWFADRIDAQIGLAFIFLPMYFTVFSWIFCILAVLIKKFTKRPHNLDNVA